MKKDKIGITERGDAGIHFDWVEKVDGVLGVILITKNINDKFIEKVLEYKDKIIVHATITGMGGTVIEPNVPDLNLSYYKVLNLIKAGFPLEQIVLRIDPIIPTGKGLHTANEVLLLFKDTGIKRVRVSFCDMYKHVKERFKKAGIKIPYNYSPTKEMIKNTTELFESYSNYYDFETCAEELPFQVGCISQKDMDVLNLNHSLKGSSNQRKGCMCPSNKLELLNYPTRCKHKYLYCYWK